ncbi:hypothetical protein AMTRI_Chr08g210580 [Amborella trichopoda]
MKGGGGGGGGGGVLGGGGKRGWRRLGTAVVGLVMLSMLVPLVFLLGLHSGFQSNGYIGEDRNSPLNARFPGLDPLVSDRAKNQRGDVLGSISVIEAHNSTTSSTNARSDQEQKVTGKPDPVQLPEQAEGSSPHRNTETDGIANDGGTDPAKASLSDEMEKACEHVFGSYCLWSKEHKEEMHDAVVKKMKDKLFLARAYYPSIAKHPLRDKLQRELRQNIQEFERILSEASTDSDLPHSVERKLQNMEGAIAKAKTFSVDCNNIDKKLRQILDMTEDEAYFHRKQSAFLYQLAVQTMPKSIHCLSMRLTVEFFKTEPPDEEPFLTNGYDGPSDSYHYVIFSNNILASSVVINSTVAHAKESVKLVFHIITDGQNYVAMRQWFSRSPYAFATVHIQNIEDLNLDSFGSSEPPHLSSSEEFRVSILRGGSSSLSPMRPRYLSLFSHTHFYLPQIFPDLPKVVVLGDDVVVQRDLSALWNLNLGGKVMGAVDYCQVRLGTLKGFLGSSQFDDNACAWISGLNIIDLERWREQNLTGTYRRWLQSSGKGPGWRAGALPASLITFYDMTYSLDNSWLVSGLGHDYGIDKEVIKRSAVLHYNGIMKPWLELAIPSYKRYWRKYLKRDEQFMNECNVNR